VNKHSWTTRRLAQLLGALFIFGWLTPAHAEDTAGAKRAFEEGSVAFDVGHYADAARHYEEAYQLKPDPIILYNIGQAYRLAGAKRDALRAYRAYLRRIPTAKNADEVQTRIGELQRLVDADDAMTTRPPLGTLPATGTTPPTTPAPSVTPPAPAAAATTPATSAPVDLTPAVAVHADHASKPVYKKWWLWTTVGIVVAGAVVAGVLVGTLPNNAPVAAGAHHVSF
jgi:tetratricopeptide (TPR) repeat protein